MKQRQRYLENLKTLAQTITIQMKLDLNQVLQWKIKDANDLINSQAWQQHQENEVQKYQFLNDIAKAVNQTTVNAANAIIKTLAS